MSTGKRIAFNLLFVFLFIGLGIGIGFVITNYANRDTSKPGINVDYDDGQIYVPGHYVVNPKPEGAKEYLEKKYEQLYAYEFIDGYFVAYKYNNANERYEYLNSTSCGRVCEIASYVHFTYEDLDVGRVVINSDDKNIIFDFNKGSLGTYDYIELIEDNDEKYFIVKNDNQCSLMTLYGKTLYSVNGELTDWDLAGNKGLDGYMYSIKNNLMVYHENNKYGLLKLDDGAILIGAKFDYLRLLYYSHNEFNTSYVKIKEKDKWYLYNIKENKKVLDTGYDQIITVYNDVLVVEENKNIYFKNLKGNNLVNDSVKISQSFEDIDYDWEIISNNISFKVSDSNIYVVMPNNNENLYYSFEDDGIEDNGKYYDNLEEYIEAGQKNITVYRFDINNKKLTKLN